MELTSSIGPTQIRLLEHGDENFFLQLSNSLGPTTRELFAPYNWGTAAQIQDFREAINSCLSRKDLSYLMFSSDNAPIGHFALWSAKKEHAWKGQSLRIPTLGICIADDYQGKGLGRIGVNFLQERAREIGADAIELTFASQNERAGKLYRSVGFEDIGMLRIPLGVNPASEQVDLNSVKSWRTERHFVFIIRREKESLVKDYLKSKQER